MITKIKNATIIQDGRLVGAVTHVLVDDPTRGYGIFAEDMLTTADGVVRQDGAA